MSCVFVADADFGNGGNSESSNKGPSGGNSSGGSSGKPPGSEWWRDLLENQQQVLIALALAAGMAFLLLKSGKENREINWQEFRTNYLEKGEVSLVTFVICMAREWWSRLDSVKAFQLKTNVIIHVL